MIAAWLRSFFRYASLPAASLRAMRLAYAFIDVLPEEREAIAVELATRELAEALERTIEEHACVWTARGGRS